MNRKRRPQNVSSPVRAFCSSLCILTVVTARAQSTNELATNAPSVSPPENSGFDDKLTGGWGGERQRLANAGISPNAQLFLEGFGNSQGGVDTGIVGASTFDLNVALDTQKAIGWKGGEFYVDLEDHAGRDPTTALTGDVQVFDRLNASPYFQVFELWYQQELFDGRLRLKLGKIDANTEFSVIDNGLPFLNASTQVTPIITPFPTTPDPMPSADIFLTPVESWYAAFMASYANRSDTFGVFTGHPGSIQPTQFGTLLIGETGLKWNHGLFGKDGNLKAGIWYHTGTFTRLLGGTQSGSSGFYGIFDQTLWQPDGESAQGRGLRTFIEAGRTQGNVSTIDWNIAPGLTWTGLIAARPNDILGFSANYAHISPQAETSHPYELSLEWIYQVPLWKWATLTPDLQFIMHPSGKYSNALVGTLNLNIQF